MSEDYARLREAKGFEFLNNQFLIGEHAVYLYFSNGFDRTFSIPKETAKDLAAEIIKAYK